MENTFAPQSEKTFYQDGNVTVTQSRLVAYGKTFAMRNISSVSSHHIKKSLIAPILLIIAGITLLTMKATLVFGIILLAWGVLIIVFNKDEYAVRVNSNSGEANAFKSKDKVYVMKVVTAVNDAIVYRG